MTEELNLEGIEARRAIAAEYAMSVPTDVFVLIETDVPALCREVRRLRDWQARAAYVFQLMMRRTINPRHTLTITEIEHLEHFPRELLSELEGRK